MYAKINVIILMLTIPSLMIFSYYHQDNKKVLEKEIQESIINRLLFFSYQVDTTVNQLSMNALSLLNDPEIRHYVDTVGTLGEYEKLVVIKGVETRLKTLSLSSAWSNYVKVYAPKWDRIVTSNSSSAFPESLSPLLVESEPLEERQRWRLKEDAQQVPNYFFRQIMDPAWDASATIIIELGFPVTELQQMLGKLTQSSDKGQAFLWDGQDTLIVSDAFLGEIALELVKNAPENKAAASGVFKANYNNQEYLLSYAKSSTLGYYLVEYAPLEEIFSQIDRNNTLIYLSFLLAMVLFSGASLFLYRNVKRPIHHLTKGVQRIAEGQYSFRVRETNSSEFGYLTHKFNEMTAQIQRLIERVYEEQLRAKDATLKQLQSQINPHFLYNCLYFVKNKATVGDHKSVIQMALSLGEYYRYTTRLEKQTAPLKDEIKFLESYLRIQNLRLQKIKYVIDIPQELQELEVPRLILQPIIENSIVHGIEPCDQGQVRITAEIAEHVCIYIDDDGVGLTHEEIAELNRKIRQAQAGDTMGYGLWNVHQRLVHYFGESAGLEYSLSPLGGLRAVLVWKRQDDELLQEES